MRRSTYGRCKAVSSGARRRRWCSRGGRGTADGGSRAGITSQEGDADHQGHELRHERWEALVGEREHDQRPDPQPIASHPVRRETAPVRSTDAPNAVIASAEATMNTTSSSYVHTCNAKARPVAITHAVAATA